MKPLTKSEMEADLAATERDIARLELIVANLAEFMSDSGCEDRQGYRVDLWKWEALTVQSKALRAKIQIALAKAEGRAE